MKYSQEQLKIQEILIRLVENEFGDKDVAILNQWLIQNPDAISDYYEFLRDYAIIALRVSNEINTNEVYEDDQFDRSIWAALKEVEDTAPVFHIESDSTPQQSQIIRMQPKIRRQIKKSSLVTVVISFAAILLFAISIRFIPVKSATPVASITSDYNTIWNGAGETLLSGSRLWNDWRQYQLDRGVAEITFDSGATILVEAPARFQLVNENEMTFEGSLTAYVPLAAQGFTVHTSNSTIIDLGTKFGLMTETGNSQIHVQEGKVLLELTTSEHKTVKQLVEADHGYQIDHEGAYSEIPFDISHFRWETPDSYEQAVYKTNPICYWRFDRQQTNYMPNEINIEDTSGSYNGLVQTDVAGPNLGNNKANSALRLLGKVTDTKDIIPTGYISLGNSGKHLKNSNSYTMVMWICPEELGIQNILAYSGEKSETVQTLESYSDQLYLNENNQISYYMYCSDSAKNNQALQSISDNSSVRLNTWYHVAATYSEDKIVKLYVNGKLKAKKQLPSIPETYLYGYIGCATINPYYDLSENDRLTREPFTGIIDEVALYNRELSAKEILLLYHAVNPK